MDLGLVLGVGFNKEGATGDRDVVVWVVLKGFWAHYPGREEDLTGGEADAGVSVADLEGCG